MQRCFVCLCRQEYEQTSADKKKGLATETKARSGEHTTQLQEQRAQQQQSTDEGEEEEDDEEDDDDSTADTSYDATSSSVSPYSSGDEQAAEHNNRRNRNLHPPTTPAQPAPSATNPTYPLDPSQPPPLSALPALLRSNASFMSDYGPLRMSMAAFILGCGVAGGVALAVYMGDRGYGWQLGAFVSCWCLFHWMEYAMTGLFHPGNLCFTSFLLNHSRAFHLALLASLLEYIIESLLAPSLKQSRLPYIALPALLLCQSLRSLSMYHGSTNFTHIISHTAAPTHHLITGGLYALSRHPSYTAWLGWSVCTQLLLCNPVCAVGFAVVGWQFFQRRIEYEERTLCSFFGRQYEEYVRCVWVGIPFLTTSTELRCRSMPAK